MRWRDAKRGKHKNRSETKKDSIKISPLTDRVKAFLTDSFMIFMPIIYIVFYMIMGSREEFRAHMLMGWIYILTPHLIITTLFLYLKGQTPGYRAYNIKLMSFKDEKPMLFQVILRYIVFTITLFIFPLLFVHFFTKNRLGLQDYISRTLPLKS